MNLSKNIAVPMALSFAMMAGSAIAQENDNELSFTCDMPDLSTMTLQDRLETIMPANVYITTASQRELTDEQRAEIPEGMEPPLSRGSGSGFIVDPNGIILTNHHVIDGADEVTVTFYNPNALNNRGREVSATVIGSDDRLDVAVLQINVNGELPCVELGDSDLVRRGDEVAAIGNPNGLAFTFTRGYVSHTIRNLGNPFYDFIQTDAAINPGNSGGGLYNEAGEVVGINSAIISRTRTNSGLGLVIKSNDVAEAADEIMRYGEVQRAGLGVRISNIDTGMSVSLGLEEGRGVLVEGVAPNRPAAVGGMLAGDVILDFGGVEVDTTQELIREISRYNPNDEVAVKIFRDGEVMTLNFDLTDRNSAVQNMDPQEQPTPAPAPTPVP